MTYNVYVSNQPKGNIMTYFVFYGVNPKSGSMRKLAAYSPFDDLNAAFDFWTQRGYTDFEVKVEKR